MLDAFFIIHCVICVLLVISIMLQRSGSSTFAGLGSTNSSGVISNQAANKFMIKTTFNLMALFMINCLILGNMISKSDKKLRDIDSVKELQTENTSIPLAK